MNYGLQTFENHMGGAQAFFPWKRGLWQSHSPQNVLEAATNWCTYTIVTLFSIKEKSSIRYPWPIQDIYTAFTIYGKLAISAQFYIKEQNKNWAIKQPLTHRVHFSIWCDWNGPHCHPYAMSILQGLKISLTGLHWQAHFVGQFELHKC